MHVKYSHKLKKKSSKCGDILMVRTGNVDFSCKRLTSIEIRKSKYHMIRRVCFRWEPPPRKISGSALAVGCQVPYFNYTRHSGFEARLLPSVTTLPPTFSKKASAVADGFFINWGGGGGGLIPKWGGNHSLDLISNTRG